MKLLIHLLALVVILTACQPPSTPLDGSMAQLPFELQKKGQWKESYTLADSLLRKSIDLESVNKLKVLKGVNLRYLELYDSATSYFQACFEESKGTYQAAWSAYYLGDLEYLKWAYYKTGNMTLSKEWLDRSSKLFESIGDTAGLSIYHYRMGTFSQINKEPDASEYFSQSYDLARSIQDTAGIVRSLTHLGVGFFRNEQYDSALLSLRKTVQLNELSGNAYSLSHAYTNLGMVLMATDQNREAKTYFDKGETVSEMLGNGILLGKSYLWLGRYFKKAEEMDLAKDYFQKGRQITQEFNYQNFVKAFDSELDQFQ